LSQLCACALLMTCDFYVVPPSMAPSTMVYSE
jgi:hypothetical protein